MNFSFDVDTYKTHFLGGAKQYLFCVLLSVPTSNNAANPGDDTLNSLFSSFGYGSASRFLPFLVRSTTLPESSFEEISNQYQVHNYKMAGARTFNDWTVSFNVDEQGRVVSLFNDWHDKIYSPSTLQYGSPDMYMLDQHMYMLDGNNQGILHYTLYQAWPKTIGSVSLDYSSTEIATMDVTFSYQYYKVEKMTSTDKTGSDLLRTTLNKLTGSAIGIPRLF